MSHKILAGLCAAAIGVTVACSGSNGSPASPSSAVAGTTAAAADGSTLKIPAPTLVSPVNNFQFQPNGGIVLTLNNVSGTFASFPVTYEVEIRDASNALVANPKFAASAGATSSVTVTSTLTANVAMTWRARATFQTGVGPWSSFAAFKTPVAAFLGGPSGSEAFDPLTTGFSVGQVHGGHFVPGQGWEADSLTDGIDYDLATCISCRVEFDVTHFGNGLGNPADLKWISMGDATTFGDFGSFRDGLWKMHLEQRGDGDGTGMKITWRNGCETCGNDDPGDHVTKIDSTVDWQPDQVYHFVFDWTPAGFTISVDGTVWFQDTFSAGNPYAPPNFRVSLGCYPRGETEVGAIWRNVRITKH